jgi:hypothetical protein
MVVFGEPTLAGGDRMTALNSSIASTNLETLVRRTPHNTVDATARLLGVAAERRAGAAFLARALNALATIAERADEATLIDAAGAPSDYAALVQLLERPEVLADLRAVDPLAPARIRGLRARDWLLREEGGIVSAAQAAQALGVTRQAVDKRRKRGTLIGLDLGRRGYAYPVWQIGPEGALPGLDAVLRELRDESPWGQAAFFLTTNVWLDGATPLAALRRGEVDRVLRAAELLGDQVAV